MKKNQSNGGGILFLLLEIIGLLIIVIGAYLYFRVNSDFLNKVVSKNNVDVIASGKCGLTVTSHSPNSKVAFPLNIKGVIDNSNSQQNGCSWIIFEGQAGTAQIYFKDSNDEWKKLGEPKPIMAPDWTSTNVLFSVGLNFNNEGIGLPNGTELKVLFTEENVSGLPPVDTYELFLILNQDLSRVGEENATSSTSATSSELMSLVLYIQDKEIAKTRDCGVTKKVVYQVPKTSAVADASLKYLFNSELSKYAVYKSVSITGGVAKIMFASDNTPEGRPIGGLSSCESSHLMSVLNDTLKQYKTIKSVELYSPKGKILF